ncbi:hypothetical protein [Pseudomonas syringae]
MCLERDATIGDNVRISALTHITGNCLIGDNVQYGRSRLWYISNA